jgi:hypothetical protein
MTRPLLFAGHSPLFEPRSLRFAPFELGGMGRAGPFGRLEGRGMRSAEQGLRLEGRAMGREEVFEGREVPSEWEGDGGMRLAGLVARRLAPALFDN